MNSIINRSLLTQTSLDSSSLTVLASVMHKFSETGEYSGMLFRGTNNVGRFDISVRDPADLQHIQIDLKKLDAQTGFHQNNPNRFVIRSGGFAVFYVSTGIGGYSLEIHKTGKDGPAKVFDSRELKDQDFFTVLVIRPGTYSITETNTNAKGEILVSYPEAGTKQQNPQPVLIDCTKNAFSTKIQTHPGQQLIFNSKSQFRIKIDLTKPDDRERPSTAEKLKAKTTKPADPSKKIRRRITSNF